jgi:hypothetical protein
MDKWLKLIGTTLNAVAGVGGSSWLDVASDGLRAVLGEKGPHQPIYHGRLPIGSLLCCRLAAIADHTGIYVGRGKIIHRDGDGYLDEVSPEKFLARLDGRNCADTIYVATNAGCPLGGAYAARAARKALRDPDMQGYNLLFKNCHQFSCWCLTGEKILPAFTALEVQLQRRYEMDYIAWYQWDFRSERKGEKR